ncbi:hypothetical protein BDD43_1214 [Mucilaginibacter gracilis]|uniref:Uncharacterized protein n=1 Tax=Mucilaginibacter gracilis TaxID=423350 RepID=A0A495IWM1_9SPHI|nr:hypothetical protein [Mucilaginibacter gracilis]RKR81070.1 hypothetical protein BDD43_1214 [Mucilaginibacter gracilis]
MDAILAENDRDDQVSTQKIKCRPHPVGKPFGSQLSSTQSKYCIHKKTFGDNCQLDNNILALMLHFTQLGKAVSDSISDRLVNYRRVLHKFRLDMYTLMYRL